MSSNTDKGEDILIKLPDEPKISDLVNLSFPEEAFHLSEEVAFKTVSTPRDSTPPNIDKINDPDISIDLTVESKTTSKVNSADRSMDSEDTKQATNLSQQKMKEYTENIKRDAKFAKLLEEASLKQEESTAPKRKYYIQGSDNL